MRRVFFAGVSDGLTMQSKCSAFLGQQSDSIFSQMEKSGIKLAKHSDTRFSIDMSPDSIS